MGRRVVPLFIPAHLLILGLVILIHTLGSIVFRGKKRVRSRRPRPEDLAARCSREIPDESAGDAVIEHSTVEDEVVDDSPRSGDRDAAATPDDLVDTPISCDIPKFADRAAPILYLSELKSRLMRQKTATVQSLPDSSSDAAEIACLAQDEELQLTSVVTSQIPAGKSEPVLPHSNQSLDDLLENVLMLGPKRHRQDEAPAGPIATP